MIRLRFRRNALAVTAIAAALAASSIFRASGNQPEEASAAITPSGELLRLGSGTFEWAGRDAVWDRNREAFPYAAGRSH